MQSIASEILAESKLDEILRGLRKSSHLGECYYATERLQKTYETFVVESALQKTWDELSSDGTNQDLCKKTLVANITAIIRSEIDSLLSVCSGEAAKIIKQHL
jgi:hypothetical protein